MITLNISNDNNNSDFRTITEALASLDNKSSEAVQLMIAPGIYKEKVEITRSNVTLCGTGFSASDTVITYDDCAFALMDDGSKRGTFRSYTMLVDASDVTLKNLTVSNTSGSEFSAGQAIALYSDGDRLTFEACRFESRQDTVFTGPLPPKEIQPGGFIGPKQFAPRINGHQYFHNCYICGNIDFIFGSATAYFDECTIESISHGKEAIQGYVTAPSTPEGQKYGYVFNKCNFISSQCPDSTVYLSRPWREYAKAVFIDCTIGSHIHPDGFHDWNKPASHENAFFSTYGCKATSGSEFIPHATFAKSIDNNAYSIYNKKAVMEQ